MRARGTLGLVLLLISGIEVFSQKREFLSPADIFDQAGVLSDSGRYTDAISLLRTIDARDTAYAAAQMKVVYAFIGNDQADSALRITKRALLEKSSQRADYLRLHGIALSKTDYKGAVEILEQAVKEYPTLVYVRYSLATVHFDNKQYDKATQQCFKLLEINPYYSLAHKLLSRMAILQGHKTHAMMAMGIYLGTNPSDNAALVLLNQVADNQVSDEGSVTAYSRNDPARLDQMIRAKVVMAETFKSAFPIAAPVVRQFELIFDQLNTLSQNSGDEYLKQYLSVYQSIKTDNLVQPFIYHILTSTSIEAATRWRNKNEKVLAQFYGTVNSALAKPRASLAFPELGFPEKTNARFDKMNRVSSIGAVQNDKPVGHWIHLHVNGEKSAEGTYRPDGTKGGVWNYFYDTGQKKSVENMDTGDVTAYAKEGHKSEHLFLKADKIDGTAEIFYPNGERNKLITYVAGERHGSEKDYYADGKLAATFTYNHGKIEGPYELFHPNGKIKIRTTFNEGYYNGKFEEYYINGSLKSSGNYTSGEITGPWKYYHRNGKLSAAGAYSPKGARTGEWMYYDHAGALTAKDKYDGEGRAEGTNIFYEDGKQKYAWEYKKDALIRHTSFDIDGKVIFTAGNNSGTFYVKVYEMDGVLSREGNYVKGKADGLWKYYNRYGTLIREYHYKDSELHGKATDYFLTGKIEAEVNYDKGEKEGAYVSHHSDGGVLQEGWYVAGNPEQKWSTYFADGTLQTDSYYISGDETGTTTQFSVDGKRSLNILYSGLLVNNEEYYNSKGKLSSVKHTDGTTDIYEQVYSNGKPKTRDVLMAGNYFNNRISYYPDGSAHYEYEMLLNKRQGKYVYYHPNGKVSSRGLYEDGDRTGLWERFHENGKLSSVGKYFEGREDSVWTFYNDDGSVSSRGPRKDGQRHGIIAYYNTEGKIILEKQFREDELVAYRSLTGPTPGPWVKFNGTGPIDLSYPDGKPAWHQEYRNGMLHGAQREYYANGNLLEEAEYTNGDREGLLKGYHPNGRLKVKEQFRKDNLDGTLEYYNDSGEPIYRAQYRLGYLHGKFALYERGKEVKNYNFWNGGVEQ